MADSGTEAGKGTGSGIQVLGLCRFSVPSTRGFQSGPSDPDERREWLYRPARLDQRLAWVETVMLPALAAQKDPDSRVVVMAGEDLPAPWRDRLEALAAVLPQLTTHAMPYGDHRALCARALAGEIDRGATWVAQFRLDDDDADAVTVDFTRRLRRDVRRLQPFLRRQREVAIDYARGIELIVRPGEVDAQPVFLSAWTAGLAVATHPDDGHYILDRRFAHGSLWWRIATVQMVENVMFLRGRHGGNDSAGGLKGVPFALDPDDIRRQLRKRFRIDLDTLADVSTRLVGP